MASGTRELAIVEVPGALLTDEILEPRGRTAFAMAAGETLRIVDLEGQQVADLVCFSRVDTSEKISVHVTAMVQGTIYLGTGHSLLSDRCRKLMTITADRCGRHDLLAGSCNEGTNRFRYGVADTPNCRSNLEQALEPFGIPLREIPYSFNVFMNVGLEPDGRIATRAPLSKPGDYIDLRAEMDLIVGISNCPSDQGPCNGYNPTRLRISTFAAQ
jgi:hypothetical protein